MSRTEPCNPGTPTTRRSAPSGSPAKSTTRTRRGFYFDYQKNCTGAAFLDGGDQCRDRETTGSLWAALGGFGSDSPEAGNQVWDDREKIVQANWSSPATNRLLVEAGALVVQQPLGRAKTPGTQTHMISVTELCRNVRVKVFRCRSSRIAGGIPRPQRSAAQRVECLGLVRHRCAQHEGRLSGGLSGAAAVQDRRQPGALHVELARLSAACRADAYAAHAARCTALQQSHALRRLLRAGSVDDESSDAARRLALRARLELVPRR